MIHTFAGIVVFLVGLYVLFRNKHYAEVGLESQRLLGTSFSGPMAFWFYRGCALIGGAIGIAMGIALLRGAS